MAYNGAALRAKLKATGMTQKTLAHKVGKEPLQVNRWLKGASSENKTL